VCDGDSVQLFSSSYNASMINYQWSMPSGNPSSSNLQNPVVFYSAPGKYSVTLTASNATGSNSVTRDSFIVISAVPVFTPPYIEDFETAGTFPGSSGYIINNDASNNTWKRVTNVGYSGTSSIKMDNYAGNKPDLKDSWVTPGFDLTNYTPCQMTFKLAYAQKDATKLDKLTVYVSTN